MKTAAMMWKSQYFPVSVFVFIIISIKQKIMIMYVLYRRDCLCYANYLNEGENHDNINIFYTGGFF